MNIKKIAGTTMRGIHSIFLDKNKKIRRNYGSLYNRKIKKNTILYETRDGQSILDSPYSIFLKLVSDSRFDNYQHIWVVKDVNYPTAIKLKETYGEKVTFVKRETAAYAKWLAKAEYLINNSTFPSFFEKKEGQIYINTWHGTPLKYMGFDIPGDPSHSQNVLRNLLMTDYIISPNEHTTSIFSEKYKLSGLYKGVILEGGYPRIDFTYHTDRNGLIQDLSQAGLKIDKRKPIILYTPTWKGTSVTSPQNDLAQIVQELLLLKEKFSSQYNILVKVHPYIYDKARQESRIANLLIPDFFDPNVVLSATDLLITDYSSIFFDYLVTKKPIVFYCWDKDLYDFERGMYFEESELPGPTVETLPELIKVIENIQIVQSQYEENYQKMSAEISKYEDGNVTDRYINRIFFEQASPSIKEYVNNQEKEKLLIYPGQFKNNGITTSLINLTDNIDYEKYDVSLLVKNIKTDEQLKNLAKINPNVRLIFISGAPIYTLTEAIRNKIVQNYGLNKKFRFIYPEKGYRKETKRILGGASFDAAIDFSGYSFFWAKYILSADAKKKIIYQHNDLFSDSKKVINGIVVHAKPLGALFTVYYKFDRILSVSKETMEVNKKNLAEYIRDNQMGFSINTINSDRVFNKKKESKVEEKITVERYSAVICKEGYYEIANNLTDIKSKRTKSEFISDESILEVLATYKNFVKIRVNNVYKGWIEKQFVQKKAITLDIRIQDAYLVGTVQIPTENQLVYKEPNMNAEVVTPAIFLQKKYVLIDKIASTEGKQFYQINIDKKTVGWIDSSLIQNIHNMRHFKFLAYYLLKQNSQNKFGISQVYEQNIDMYGRLINSISNVWKYPPKTTLEEEFSMSLDKGKLLRLKSKMCVDDVVYYLVDDVQQTYWVKKSDLVFISDEEIINIGPIVKSVNLIVSERDNLEQTYTADKMLIYPNRTLYSIIDAPDKMIDATKVEIIEDRGIYNINGEIVPPIDDEYFNVATMGRLSIEKNHKNLILAFKKFLEEFPKSRLYILGDGVLKEELMHLICEQNLQDSVILLGHQENPFCIVKKMDVFVLFSLYEGQPMVLLEALMLQVPVLASDIVANKSVLNDGEYGGLVSGTDINAISNGLTTFVREKPVYQYFDYKVYNEKAVENFYKEVQI